MKVLLKRLEAGLRRRSPLTITTIALGWVLALGIADYYTPSTLTLTAFYFLAVVLAGWGAGKWQACLVSAVAALTTFTVCWVLQRGVPHPGWVALWNNSTRFLMFCLTGCLTAELTTVTRGLEKQVAERTAQWKTEAEEHKLTEALYRTLFELSPDGILLEDTDGNILDANHALCHLAGYSREALAGQNARCFVPAENQGEVEAHLAALKAGRALEHEVWNVRTNGERRLMWLNEKPLALPDGRQGILVVARDITKTKRAELTKEVFLSLGAKLSAAGNPVEAARAIYAGADLLWKWDGASLDLYSPESNRIEPVLNYDVLNGERREVPAARPGAAPTARMRRILEQGAELILAGQPGAQDGCERFGDTLRPSASMMHVPLRREGQPVGTLSIHSYTSNAYTEEDLRTLQALADYCGGALDRLRAEAAQRESEEENRAILATAMDGFLALDFAADPQGAITDVNEAYCRTTGYSREELLGMRITDLEARESPEEVGQHKERILSGPGDRFETRHRRKDGQEIHVEISAFRWAGSGQRIFDFVRDITERKKAEQSLAEALEFNRQVVSASAVGIGVYKASGHCVMVNNAVAQITGGTVEQLLEQDFRRLESWRADGLLAKAETALATRQPQELECRSRTTFGRDLTVSVRFSCFVAQGELHLLLMLTDQTAATRTRDALRASEERYRTLAESSPDAIFILDREIRVEYVNSMAAALWKRAPAELIGLKQPELFPPEAAQHHQEAVRRVFSTGTPVCREEPLTFPSGDQWIEVRLAPLYDARGSVASVMGVCRDITERKHAESLLRAQRDLGVSLSTTSDASAALRCFLEAALKTGGFDSGGVYLLNEATQTLDLAEHRGASPSFVEAVAQFAADSPQMKVVRDGRPVFTSYDKLGVPLDEVRLREGLQAIALLPLNHEREIIGALALASHTEKHISAQTRLVVEALAAQAAGAIARIRAEAERHRLERQLLEITDREHARVGQDIHDGLCQHLVSLAFDANSLARELSSQRRAQAPMARRMAELVDQAITETRQLARGLFPVRLESEGLPSALEELAKATRDRFKIHCRFRSKGAATVRSSTIATHLYRIAQEAVANAVKHSQARVISIDLTTEDNQLRLKVRDDGQGLRPKTSKGADGMGLHIMDYRARSIGGTLRVTSRPRCGTLVFCCVPRHLR